MPEYLEDPSVLTKDKLKSELLVNNVALPTGDQRKDVYVQLYLKNLTVQNNKILSTDAFSSDEELPVPVVSNKSRSGRKATRKTDKPRSEDLDVTELTSEGLKDELLKYGINVGPIVASTRKLYERRLQKLLDQGPPETVALPVVITQVDGNHNGNSDSDRYSDKEEEVTTEPEPVPVPVVERPVRSRGKTPVTTRTRSSQHNRVEKIAAGEQTPNRVDEKDVLKEMFPYETNTPTGINATCRRPIRGAAGRPLKSGDLWTDETLLRSSHSSYTESRTATVHRVTTLPPSTRQATSVAPPAGKTIAPPHGLPVWLKLLLLGIVAGFIFFIYQTMETNAMAPFGGSSDSTQTSGHEVRK
ncbi:lamina-associated polypeptide 2, isoforms beta/gamma-like isoform 16-T16 [Salvelinus alpinus]|uniref:lamina-associated polypeptide 2, isoforms beta/gamma isoform X9 n=1 Tax=Salvelinus sp. IW2-2015 TaxID=2691554 RepID=UPI000CDF8094|nr:lamina-associated polypeptide 2, isoforms beta/gamma isoform X10 [Salvelinus alpinus]